MNRSFAVRLMTTRRDPDPITGRRAVYARWVRIEAESGDEAAKKAIASTIAETGIVQVRGVTMWDPQIHEAKPDVAPVEVSPPGGNPNATYHAKRIWHDRWGVFDNQGVRQNKDEKMDEDTARMFAEAISGRAAVA